MLLNIWQPSFRLVTYTGYVLYTLFKLWTGLPSTKTKQWSKYLKEQKKTLSCLSGLPVLFRIFYSFVRIKESLLQKVKSTYLIMIYIFKRNYILTLSEPLRPPTQWLKCLTKKKYIYNLPKKFFTPSSLPARNVDKS